MPEETLEVEETVEVEIERRPVPVFKLAAVGITAFYTYRTVRNIRAIRRMKKMNDAVDNIMNTDNVHPIKSYDPSLHVVEGTCVEIT